MMHLKNTQKTISILISLSMLLIVIPFNSLAEEKPPTLAGRLINENGEPIVDSTVILLYVKLREYAGLDPLYDSSLYPFLSQGFSRHRPGMENPPPDEQMLREHPPYQTSVKDEEGNFVFTGIVPGIVQLMVIPDERLEKDAPANNPGERRFIPLPEIHAIKFGKYQFYPHSFSISPETGGVTFTIKPGADISNVEVIMKSEGGKHQKIHGRIEFKNGQLLIEKSVRMVIFQLDMDGTDGSVEDFSLWTDTNGNFELSVRNYGIHTIKLGYMGLSTISDLFIVKDRIPYKDLVLTLNGDSSDISDTKTFHINESYIPFNSIIDFPDVWVINPENGHAYKAIRCDGTRNDAIAKAEAEDAHLVSITSETEKVWLTLVYEGMKYWIGLKYDQDDTRWEWDSGEPFSFMNWDMSDISTPGFAVPRDIPNQTNDFVIMSRKGKWERTQSLGPTRMAVIEKNKFSTEPKPQVK